MIAAHGSIEGSALDRWADTLADLHARIARRFGAPTSRQFAD